MGELRNVIETKRKILTMIKGAKNEKRHQSHLWNLWKKLLDWGKLHNQRLQKLIRIGQKQKKKHPCLTKTLTKSPGLNLWVSFCVWLKLITEFGWFTATKDSEGQAESSQALETLCERIRSETLLSSILCLKMQPFISYILIIL